MLGNKLRKCAVKLLEFRSSQNRTRASTFTVLADKARDKRMESNTMSITRKLVVKVLSAWHFIAKAMLAVILLAGPASAEVTLTIVSPSGTKEMALSESPIIEISYTATGMRLEFKNLAITAQCIGDDISKDSGLCLLKTYSAEIVGEGGGDPVTSAPDRPTDVVANSSTPGQVDLSWVAPTDNGGAEITGYRIQQASGATSTSFSTIVDDTGTTATAYTIDTGLTEGSIYRFRVAAINSVGAGANSSISAPVTVAETPLDPDNLSLADACRSKPNNVTCDITVIPANFYSDVWGEEVTQPANKILTLPFIVEASTTGTGFFSFKSFMSAVDAAKDYQWTFWISATPGGEELRGDCSTTNPLSRLNWAQGSGGSLTCDIGTEKRFLYANGKVAKPIYETQDDGTEEQVGETLYPYGPSSSSSRQVKYTVQGTLRVGP